MDFLAGRHKQSYIHGISTSFKSPHRIFEYQLIHRTHFFNEMCSLIPGTLFITTGDIIRLGVQSDRLLVSCNKD